MRTTINLDDDISQDLKIYAQANGISFNRAVNTILKREFQPRTRLKRLSNGLTVLVHPPGTPKITTEQVLDFLTREPW